MSRDDLNIVVVGNGRKQIVNTQQRVPRREYRHCKVNRSACSDVCEFRITKSCEDLEIKLIRAARRAALCFALGLSFYQHKGHERVLLKAHVFHVFGFHERGASGGP